jgi:hypothetical protein
MAEVILQPRLVAEYLHRHPMALVSIAELAHYLGCEKKICRVLLLTLKAAVRDHGISVVQSQGEHFSTMNGAVTSVDTLVFWLIQSGIQPKLAWKQVWRAILQGRLLLTYR